MTRRQEKVKAELQRLVAEFLNHKAETKSVITVTRCEVSSDLKKATVLISVFPEQYEQEALNFAKRQRSALRGYIAEKIKMKTLPFIDVVIDEGEKNRLKIEELFGKINNQ